MPNALKRAVSRLAKWASKRGLLPRALDRRTSGTAPTAEAVAKSAGELAARLAALPAETGSRAALALIAAQRVLTGALRHATATGRVRAPLYAAERKQAVAAANAAFVAGDFDQAVATLLRLNMSYDDCSLCLEMLGTVLQGANRTAASRAYWLAAMLDPGGRRAIRLARRFFRIGSLSSAAVLMQARPEGSDYPEIGEFLYSTSVFASEPQIPSRAQRSGRPILHIAYVAASALPFVRNGYAVRTHALLKAFRSTGTSVTCFLRPGFPWDRKIPLPGGGVPSIDTVDGIDYVYTHYDEMPEPSARLAERMSAALERRFRDARPAVVIAASNHRNALPALIAARRVGARFAYEVRGMWELTTASRDGSWEDTERFAFDQAQELRIASEADHVLAITAGIAEELVRRGVDPGKISLLPNGVDAGAFGPMEKDAALTSQYSLNSDDFVLVYCGSLTLYEGLDDLIEAVGLLRERGVGARLLIVGDGPARAELEALAERRQLSDAVSFAGSVDPAEVRRYWSLADAVALPRKPLKVCEIVSPLKPFEAMAMGKPVVLSNLPVLAEIVTDGETGRLCEPASPLHLASILEELAREPALRTRLGNAGREWVLAHRTWGGNVEGVKAVLAALAPGSMPLEGAAHEAGAALAPVP